MTSLNDARAQFLEFFKGRGHEVVPSAPLVPQGDATLLFVNAGMVPFKNVFTGAETRDYVRATSAQKCVRAGGKHNDLDNVGYTARHHTFFEMLGNFSFGDYFKEEAIDAAWNLVTGVYGLPAEKLSVTVYHTDDEAFDLWRKISGLPDERIIRIATNDNFWSMGETGPCGPCSEIFYDHGPEIWGGPPGSPEEDGDRFIEIWNLVFMQHETLAGGERIDLPKPSIDTGMGLERMAAVLQGVHSNYEVDLFRTLMAASEEATGRKAEGDDAAAHRVIADHLRSSAFLIADGVSPSNEGRGYVLRRIMRRAMRYAHGLGARDPLLVKLAPTLISEMGDAYPELRRAEAFIAETLRQEEEKFQGLLDRGLKLLDDELEGLADNAALPGEAAFRLYDTYGFPLDLTQDALRRLGRDVDVDGFDAAMARQKEAARASWAGSGETADERVWFAVKEAAGETRFLGYEQDAAEGKLVAIVAGGEVRDRLEEGASAELVFAETPFYAESGGQVGDAGAIVFENGARFTVTDVQKRAGGVFAHIGRLEAGGVALGDKAALDVDVERRTRTRANHSATHLLHAALRDVLGDHVAQKGSQVGPDRLRFDFAHSKPLTPDETREIERQVNAVIRQNTPVSTREMSYDDALKAGAIALFGEKYGDDVRVLAMGDPLVLDEARPAYSVELCGGTHVGRTGDIALFVILSEGAVGSGVRRLEALTGEAARLHLAAEAGRAKEAADALKTTPQELSARLSALLDERKGLERALAEAKKQLATGGGGATTDAPEDVGGVAFLGKVLEGVAPKDLRSVADEFKARLKSGVVALVGVNEGKAALVVSVTDDLTDRLSAVELVRAGAEAVGGKGGGGRPAMAQAGGPDGAKAAEAVSAIKGVLTAL